MRICVPNFHCEDPSALRESDLSDDLSGDEAIPRYDDAGMYCADCYAMTENVASFSL